MSESHPAAPRISQADETIPADLYATSQSIPRGLWRPYLRHAPPSAQGLRRWQIWARWTANRTRRHRLLFLSKALLLPGTAALDALSAVRAHGRNVAHHCNVSHLQQFIQIILLRLRFGLTPDSYYKFSLFYPDRYRNAKDYVQSGGKLLVILAHRALSTQERQLLSDKRAFSAWCQQNGFPTVDTVAESANGIVRVLSPGPLPRHDLLSKPTSLRAGKGVRIWRFVSESPSARWSSNDSEHEDLSEEGLITQLGAESVRLGSPLLVQPFLRNHPELRDIGNGSLATVRLITVRNLGERAEELLAVFKIPTGRSLVDNFDSGSLACPVDLDTGVLGPGTYKRYHDPANRIQVDDPGTGGRIKGRRLPFWGETKSLALDAHGRIGSELSILGWDMAITEEGPVIIECNKYPGSDLAQIGSQNGLGETAYSRYLIGDLRRVFLE